MSVGALALIPLLTGSQAINTHKFKLFYDVYGDATWSKLTGSANYQQVRYGLRQDDLDLYVYGRNESFDTSGSNLPVQFSGRGSEVGVGARYWFMNRKLFVMATAGKSISGANKDNSVYRVGIVGYDEISNGRFFTDMYGEYVYVNLADDAFLNLRVRPGIVLNKTKDGRLWAYGLGQLWMSGKGNNGTENRIETGLGLGYVFGGMATVNFELRVGYSFRGTITDKTYFNPALVFAIGF